MIEKLKSGLVFIVTQGKAEMTRNFYDGAPVWETIEGDWDEVERTIEIERLKTIYEEYNYERDDRIRQAHEEFVESVEGLYRLAETKGLLDIEGNPPWSREYERADPKTVEAMKKLKEIAADTLKDCEINQSDNRIVYLTFENSLGYCFELCFLITELNSDPAESIMKFIQDRAAHAETITIEPKNSDEYTWVYYSDLT